MNVVLWVPDLLDDRGEVVIGGVQTYTMALAGVIRDAGGQTAIATIHKNAGSQTISGIPVLRLSRSDWQQGAAASVAGPSGLNAARAVHVACNAYDAPRNLGRTSIGIQHGIYWDRPATRLQFASRLLPTITNLWRCWRGAAVLKKFSRLVCVDYAFPTVASCVHSPLPWDTMDVIINFAPEPAAPPRIDRHIRRIVFSRRWVKHRGTRLFAASARSLLKSGWDGRIDVIGGGPDEAVLQAELDGFDNVRFYALPYERRMEAFDDETLAVIPSLSTEGTSLTCLEAWSRGALVVATCVGGLSNLIIDNHNGLLVRPLEAELTRAMRSVVERSVDIARLRRNGFETFIHSGSHTIWAQRWQNLLSSLTGDASRTDERGCHA